MVAAAQRRMAGVPETPMHVPPIQRAAGSMTSGPTGLKIDWFETQPSPGFDRLAPASRRRESKMLFHQRNKKVVAAMTQNRPLHDHSLRLQPQLSSSVARQLAAAPVRSQPRSATIEPRRLPGRQCAHARSKAAIRTTPNCAFRKPWLSLLGSIVLPREETQNENSVCCLSYYSSVRD